MIALLVMNTIVGISSFLFSRSMRLKSFSDFLITWFVVFLSQVILGEIILGVLGILSLINLFYLNSAILLILFLSFRKKPNELFFNHIKQSVKDFFNNKSVLFISSIIIAFGVVKIGFNLFSPPFGWDCLNYHFTFPVEWLKSGTLNNPITVFGDPSPPYYPINGSLIFFWYMLPLKNVFLADLGQMPFFVVSLLALYSIGRKIGLKRDYSFFGATLFILIPNVFKQLEIAYVDMMVAGLFFICLNYLLLLNKKYSLKIVCLFSISFGLFIGVKTVALPYSLLLFVPLVFILVKNKKFFSGILVFLLSVLIFGGFSYIRNFIEAGNPLYPFDFEALGITIFPGVMDKATYGAHFNIKDYSLSKLLFHEGLSGQGIVFMLLPMFLALPLAIKKQRKKVNFMFAYFLILPILIYLIYRFVIPLANTRYLYSLFGLAMILGYFVLDILNVPKKIVYGLTIVAAIAAMSTLASHGELVAGILSSLGLFFIILFFKKKDILRKLSFKPPTIAALLVLLVVFLFWGNNFYNKTEHNRYISMQKYSGFWPEATVAWQWLNANTNSNNIAYVGRPVPLPLYGEQFKNEVYYVSVNAVEPAKVHYFPNGHYSWGEDAIEMHENFKEKGNYREMASYRIWLNNLKKRKTDYLFVYSLQHTKEILFPIEEEWAKADPSVFNKVFSNKTIRIYKVTK